MLCKMERETGADTNGHDDLSNSNDTFPLKLHKMLEAVEKQGCEWIISWNGLSFSVHQPQIFAESTMRKYFNQTKYKSFQRQLNLYNFEREPHGRVRSVCEYK
jgi:hypothetical protein